MPAPKLEEGITSCVSHDRWPGLITATRGLSFSETSLALIASAAGNSGKSLRSSNSTRPALTSEGKGTKENIVIAEIDVSNPLMIRRVARNAVQPWRVRG